MKGSLSRVGTVLTAAALMGGVASCYPGSISDIGETDLVVTFFDTTANFSGVETYFMPDTIVRLDEEGDGGDDDIDRSFDEEILAEVAAQMAALGYERIDGPGDGDPDVVVLLSSNATSYQYWLGGCWYCGWGWYPWGPTWGYPWGPGYGPGYPWQPGYVGTQTVGTLLVTMLDPGSVGTEIPVLWAGLANGLLARSTDSNVARVEQAIGQMFEQSPYLGN